MPTLWVKLQLTVGEIPYTNSSGLSSKINYQYVQQEIDGVNIQVSPDISFISSVQTGPATTDVGRVTTTTYGPVSSYNFQYAIAQKGAYFPYLNSNSLFAGETDSSGDNLYVTLSGIAVDAFFVGDPGRSVSETSNAGVPTQTTTITALGPQQFTYILPQYEWVSLSLPSAALFTIGADAVNFNALTNAQIQSLPYSDLYHTLSGNDTVDLPSFANAQALGSSGVSYNLANFLVLGSGNDTVYGSPDAATNVALGTGADTVYLGGGSNSLQFGGGTAAVLFTAPAQAATLLPTLTSPAITASITGFATTDTLDFSALPNLTLSAAFGSAGEVDIYSGASVVGTLNFGNNTDTNRLEPTADASGGTEVAFDSTDYQLVNPSGSQVKWSFIQGWEGIGGLPEYAPYIPPGGLSGLTVGLGVDFGSGLITPAVLNQYFPGWQSDPNLVFLESASGDTGAQAISDLQRSAYQTTNVGPQSTAVSLTTSQVNELTTIAEQATYTEVVNAYNAAAGPSQGWDTVEAGAQTAIVDMAYNFGLPKLTSFGFWDQVTSQDWAAAANNLRTWGGPQVLASRRAADLNQLLTITPLKAQPPPKPVNQDAAVQSSSSASVYTVGNVGPSATEALDPTGTSFSLDEAAGSPPITDIVLPEADAPEYSVSYQTPGGLSAPQIVQAGDTLYIPGAGTDQIDVDLLNATGAQTTTPAEFTFYLDFATSGLFTATVESVACYLRGTIIATSGSFSRVEALKPGDMVETISGLARPVKWLGQRSYAGRFLLANPHLQPIRFRAGSLCGGLPRRDLLVSPEHAMFLDGVLVSARHLVNGSTITQEQGRERVDYYHVELDTHDVLLAEGAPSESFLDDGSRGMFANAAEFAMLYPHASKPGQFCAPKVTDGYELEAIRRKLAIVAKNAVLAA